MNAKKAFQLSAFTAGIILYQAAAGFAATQFIDPANISATASSVNYQLEPVYSCNGNGLTGDLHTNQISTGAEPPNPGEGTMWLAEQWDTQPWIIYEFDREYTLQTMWVWNYNQVVADGSTRTGRGTRDCTIEYSTDGSNWQPLGTTHTFAIADATDTYAHNTEVDFNSVRARYVKISVLNNHGGNCSGLSEVRFYAGNMVSFATSASSVLETGGTAPVEVVLSSPVQETVTVDYSVTGGTADNGTDYSLAPGTLTFSQGQTNRTITVPVTDDGMNEDDETVTITLSGLSGGDVQLGSFAEHTLTILDPRPKVSFAYAADEALENAGSVQIPVTLSWPAAADVSVDYVVTGGTATGGGVDYQIAGSALTFQPGQTAKSLTITITDDGPGEGDETVVLRLSNVSAGARLGQYQQHTFTITERTITLLKGARYERINSGQSWESAARVGPYADVAVEFEDPANRFVFWRGSSYLPYWQAGSGTWYVDELVPRNGDGPGLRYDNVNKYSHVRIIESSPARAVVHWRYMPNFSNVDWDGWVDEYFCVWPDGVCIRTMRRGRPKLDDWLSESNLTLQRLRLQLDGIAELPAAWQTVPQLVLEADSQAHYNNEGFMEERRAYNLRCRRNGMPAELEFTLDTSGGASVNNPAMVIRNWGHAAVVVRLDGRPFRNWRAGYAEQPLGADLVLWLGKRSTQPIRVTVTPLGQTTSANKAPRVDAGEDISLLVSPGAPGPYEANLSGSVEDDGLPSDSLTGSWTKVAGAGSAAFADAGSASTAVWLSAPGQYKLRLTAGDGQLSSSDDVLVTVKTDSVPAGSPDAWLRFNEGSGDATVEQIGGISCAIGGHKSLWKAGILGSCLQFDGYESVVTLPQAHTPSVSGGLTVEAWVAVGANPWNWAPIVHQSSWESSGWYLGINKSGRLGFMVSAGGGWQSLVSSASLERYRWTHVAGTYSPSSGQIKLYIDGSPAGSRSAGGAISTAGRDLLIGRNNTPITPTDPVREDATLPTWYGFDGLIDEVKIYGRALDASQISGEYAQTAPDPLQREEPAMQQRILPSKPADSDRFGAFYRKLSYYETWDNMWRVSEHPDVIVKYNFAPVSTVFWRGTSYGQGWSTENNLWISDQSVEEGGGGTMSCAEHMSDKQCRHSHVRVIESTGARVVIHWRYALVDILYNQPRVDGDTGWGDWVDEYYSIYPDGAGVRDVKYWTSESRHYSLQDTQFLTPPGKRPEEIIDLESLTLVNESGQSRTLSWAGGIPGNTLSNANIEVVNLKSAYKPFVIFEVGVYIGPWGQDEKNDYTYWPAWNHWPASQILSDGRLATGTDHLIHAALGEVDTDDLSTDQMMYGFTNQSPVSLVALGKSWNRAPSLSVTGGGLSSEGYDRGQRAYILRQTQPGASQLSFSLSGSSNSPVVNPCFIVKNWDGPEQVDVSVNGSPAADGDALCGIEMSANGPRSLAVWVRTQSTTTTGFTISIRPAVPGDLDHDGDVDRADLRILLLYWLDAGPGYQDLEADLDGDGTVSFEDYAMLVALL